MRHCQLLFPILALLPLPAWSQEVTAPIAPVTTLTMDRAVQLALTQNRRIQQARLAVETARDREAQAGSWAYPVLSANALAATFLGPLDFLFPTGVFGDYAATGPIPASATNVRARSGLFATAGLQLTEPLTQQFKLARRAEIATLGRSVEEEKLRARRHSLIQQVRQACLALMHSQAGLSAVAENRTFLDEMKRVVGRGVVAGSFLKAEELALQARLADLDLQEAQLQDRQATEREQLNLLLAQDLATRVEVDPVLPSLPEEGDLAQARASALTTRPELRQARLEFEQSQLALKAARADRLPDVSAVVSQQWMGRLDPLPRSVGYAGLVLQWDVFDGGRRKKEVAIGARAVEQSRLAARELEEQVAIEVAASFRALRQSRLALRSAELGLAADRERLRNSLENQEADFAVRRDVLQQRAAYELALSRRQQALYDTWLARAAFEKAIGLD